MEDSVADKVVDIVIKLYDSLGKNGKPIECEWTCLAAFVIQNGLSGFNVVSMATGTKCIGGNSMATDGTVIFDSHAEVLARRYFLCYIYEQLKIVKTGRHSSVVKSDGKSHYRLADGIKIHFYTSQVPCGDASIIPTDVESLLPSCIGLKRKSIGDQAAGKKVRLDIHRTGAKPVKNDPRQDLKGEGAEYHTKGAVRIKPGRGDPTKSLSCSDKMAKWIYRGLQGALLSLLIPDPIKLTSITVGGAGPYDQVVLEDALLRRSGFSEFKSKNSSSDQENDAPKIFRSSIAFKSSADAFGVVRPCATSIGWADVQGKKVEVSTEGRRLGATKKSKTLHLTASKRGLFERFLSVKTGVEKMNYNQHKQFSVAYKARMSKFVEKMGSWSEDKTKYEHFEID